MAKVNLGYLEQALDERIQLPFEAIQALDVIMRHLPSQSYIHGLKIIIFSLMCT